MLVQAFGAYSYDNSYTVDSAAAAPDRFVSIAIVDAEDPGSPATVSALAQRESVHRHPTVLDRRAGAPPADLARPSGHLRAVAGVRGRSASASSWPASPSTCRGCSASSSSFPSSRWCSTTRLRATSTAARRTREAAALFGLVEHTNLHCKVTSHLLEAAEAQGDACDIVDRLVARVRRATGWSGDPTTRRPTTARTPSSSRSPEHACRNLSERDRALVLGGTALELWPELAR